MSYAFIGLWALNEVFKGPPPFEAWLAWAYCNAATIRRSTTNTDPFPPEPRP